VALPADRHDGMPLRYCVDWTEQAHHVSGAVGRALAGWMMERGWLERLPRSRALRITDAGVHGLTDELGVEAGFAGDGDA
jgi:hypothetical protein